MRIINGSHKGKQIKTPNNLDVRPTTNFAKEALFNILNNYFYFDSLKVLDLFAGTGNMSYEFAARDAIKVVSVEKDDKCASFIRKTADELEFDQMQIVRSDVLKFLERNVLKYNIIFADPPYDKDFDFLPELILSLNILEPEGWLIIEHDAKKDYSKLPYFHEKRKYGKVNFSIFVYNE